MHDCGVGHSEKEIRPSVPQMASRWCYMSVVQIKNDKMFASHLSMRDNEALDPELQLGGGPLSSCLSLSRDSMVV